MGKRTDLGLLLLELEGWGRASLGPGYALTSGSEAVASAFGCASPAGFLDCLEDGARGQFEADAARTGPDGVSTGAYISASGVPFEVLLAGREGGHDVFFRSMEGRVRSLESLALFYRNFLTTPTAMCYTDRDGNILEANRAFLDFYGYAMDEVRGRNPRILKSGRQSPEVYRDMWEMISDPAVGSWTGEVVNRKKDGTEVTVLLTISAVRRWGGEFIGYIASATDISRQKRLEAEILSYNAELSEMSRLKSDLMAITSHDLKAPLNSMISRANLMLDLAGQMTPGELKDHLERIVAAGMRMTAFINDLLDLEKLESGNVGLNTSRLHLDYSLALCADTVSASAAAAGVAVRTRVTGAPRPVVADAVKMEQVFMNLLSNALKFSPPGSEVEAVYHQADDGSVRVTILDRGPGIPDEDLGAIFDRFYQAKKGANIPKRGFGAGVGLGLGIVKQIVELHGGTVSARNRDGGGCEFAVELPARCAVSSGRDVAVMVHDPDACIFGYVEGPLKGKGASCFITKTPDEARRIFEYERPDVVIVRHEALGPEMAGFLSGIMAAARRPVVVNITDGEGHAGDAIYDLTLTAPVADVEVFELLRDVQAGPAL
ncbi:MAG: PAS domain-containing sensor histidine kinase [Nitrospirae bacterium]|nr:PAS domain-containing sensor histidine kinase [Nitrospirota bacterium]